jgi:hypothetical protein
VQGRPWAGLAVLLPLALAGCANHNRLSDDPLVGAASKGAKQEPTPTATTNSKSSVPAAPTATSAGSPAALALGDPLAGGKALGINDQKSQGDPTGWRGVSGETRPDKAALTAGPGGVPPAYGATLRRPEPLVEAVPPAASPPGPSVVAGNLLSPATPGLAGATLDQLQLELKVRRVSWVREKATPNGVYLVCAVPSRYNPDNPRIYTAEGADALAVRRLIIAQIDRDQPGPTTTR